MELVEEWRRREGVLYKEILCDNRISAINKGYIEQHITHLKAESLDVRVIKWQKVLRRVEWPIANVTAKSAVHVAIAI
ncbi:MAG: hypothetical protein JJ59_01325 [Candidatus Micrarchaeum sp. AZ1]|jgi:hypothetical protein|nr:MAG: hypothetical protein JJ59_01325 [Candidatus Micrarchaeum sp. AZ1]